MTGRKRHLLVDTQGGVLKVVVSAADGQDRDGARLVALAVQCFGPELPRLTKVWADGGSSGPVAEELRRQLGWEVEIVKRSDQQPKGAFCRPAAPLDRRADVRVVGWATPVE